ncbi:PEGA domain-containing protein [Polyangium aurulentum]|uniref:PEGA domain-containing protein n=1 Tax=Polyangium aurulentum TaxID=2567896 RepID=UPI00146F8B4B|nr:PEGA domain-containing protein [Polyangium aurulentum]UQA56078.1 PEGA domain-containing protein [Polyangium aurulentum]
MTTRRGRWWAAGLLLASITTGAPGAMAQVPSGGAAATDAQKDATKLLEDGKKAAKAGQWEKAREAFAAAYAQKPDPAIAGQLGLAELKASKPREAAEHLSIFLRDAPGASADEKQAAQKGLDDAKARLGTLFITVNVAGADVSVNGQAAGKTPLPGPVFLDPGSREIEVKKEGFEPAKELLVVAPGTETEMEVALAPVAAAAEPEKPPEPKKEPEPPPAPPRPKWQTYGMIGGAGLTALGLGLGIGLTVAANGKSAEADERLAVLRRNTPSTSTLCGPNGFAPHRSACAELKNTLSTQDAMANGAMAGYIIGGVAALGTVGLYLLPKTGFGRKLMGVNVMPVLPVMGGDQAGGMVVGSF